MFDANGMITAIAPANFPQAAGGATFVDLPSATCLPGLIDVHTHLTSDPSHSGYQSLGVSSASWNG